jgi:hypothetical protein
MMSNGYIPKLGTGDHTVPAAAQSMLRARPALTLFGRNLMGKFMYAGLFFLLVVGISGLSGPAYSEGLNNEVEFTGYISSVVINGEGVGTVFVRIEGFDLRVVVNLKTELSNQGGGDINMSDLAEDMHVEVAGRYSASGILASRIREIGAEDDTFELRGRITAIQASGDNKLLSLLGIQILVTADTTIESDGVEASASSLKVGMLVRANGTTSATPWVATAIDILTQLRAKERVRFEGIITEVTSESIQVAVRGLTDNITPVLLTSNTLVTGELAKDALVLVLGYLNPDLSVTAKEVRVLQALEIKPDQRKLKVGETAVFTIKLRETQANDVQVSLESSDTSVLTLSSTSVTVAKGSCVADFSAKAVKIGSAEITAAALNQTAAASVTVGEVSENDNERPGGIWIAFAPDKIKMGFNETRNVVLLVKSSAGKPVDVEISVAKGLVKVAGTQTLGNGTALWKVTVQSGADAGTDSVTATLPAALGGAKAELLIEVAGKNVVSKDHQKIEVAFRPDELQLPAGETRSVGLVLNHSLDKDVSLIVSVTGDTQCLEMPSTITIPAGLRSVQVAVKGINAGNARVVVALPEELGGDAAELKVEVRS